MSNTTIANEQINYPFLLLTHIVCADQQIHSKESKSLRELADLICIGEQTKAEMEKILAQDKCLTIEDVASKVPPDKQNETMRQVIAIAYCDGFFAPLEEKIVYQIARIWNWSTTDVERIIAEAQDINNCNNGNVDDQPQLSIAARLLKNEMQSPLSRSLINIATKLAPDTIGRKVKQLEREILLSGPEYDAAIEQCAKIANEDYKYAESALQNALSVLNDLGKNIQVGIEEVNNKTKGNGQATTAKDVAQLLKTTQNDLVTETIKKIEEVRKSFLAKQRALNHFSIAFMGRTKAGKSTLHAIVTQDGWEAIGVGKQRTTRFNRVYEWKNIRIIDTPGIGAPGGKTDEEIAGSVIEESDVICCVVTNDSIQEREFQFMKLLKNKAKPLIVLLNVKTNLRDSRQLNYFLKDPNKEFAMEGNSGLGGHFERIRRYAQQHYANDYFDIVPVMLIAAQLARESEHENNKDKLFQASRIQNFLDSIRESLIKHGALRRSQTLLGSTVGAIEQPNLWVTQQTLIYQKQTDTLKIKSENLQKQIQIAAKDNREALLQQIEAIFQDAINAIPSFAEEHWYANETAMNLGWKRKLQTINFEERLQNTYLEANQKLSKDIQEAIEEIGNELQLVANLNGFSYKFTEQDTSILDRGLIRIGSMFLGLAASILTFVAPPLMPVVTVFAVGFSVIAKLFKSRDEKRREAINKISNLLESQLNQQKQVFLQKAQDNFDKNCRSISLSVNTYFEKLTLGVEAIAVYLESANKRLDAIANHLNRAYAKRIIDWCTEQYEILSDEGINKLIAKVERDFGNSITIHTKSNIQSKKLQEDIKKVLQEDVFIQSI